MRFILNLRLNSSFITSSPVQIGVICLLQRRPANLHTRMYIAQPCQNIAAQTHKVLLDFSLTVKAATLIFISGRGSAIPSAKEGISGLIYNLVKS